MTARDVLFFGCIPGHGHHLWTPEFKMLMHADIRGFPWTMGELDPSCYPDRHGGRTPALDAWMASEAQREGEAVLTEKGGWTRLGWADRSVDTRRGAHADLFAPGAMSFDEMLSLGRRWFPSVMARFSYEVRLAANKRPQ